MAQQDQDSRGLEEQQQQQRDKASYETFEHAVAGHDGILIDPASGIIVKPCKPQEIAFYEAANNGQHQDFVPHIPLFMGTLHLTKPDEERGQQQQQDPASISAALQAQVAQLPDSSAIASAAATAVQNDAFQLTKPKGAAITTEWGIMLENIARGLTRPNILDVKLGTRLWADDAPPEKRQRLDKVSSETTNGSLGFRIAGMRIWDNEKKMYNVFDRTFGRALKQDTVVQALKDFVMPESVGRARKKNPVGLHRSYILDNFNDYLGDILGVVEKQEMRMYSGSLLFVFEGDDEALAAAVQRQDELIADLRKRESNAAGEVEAMEELNGGVAIGTIGHRRARSDGYAKLGEFINFNGTNVLLATDAEAMDEDEEDDDDDEDGERVPKLCDVRLIDFAHASWTPGQGPDENLLKGLGSLKRIFQELVDKLD